MRPLIFLLFSGLLCLAACSRAPLEPEAKTGQSEGNTSFENHAPPFSTREPEKFQAKIVFAFRFDDSPESSLEQTTFVAREGLNRRLDFELSGERISNLQTSEGKKFVLLSSQKLYAELAVSDANVFPAAPEDFSLSHLLHVKPAEAKFQKMGAEEILGTKTTKFRIDFGAVKDVGNNRTETEVWIDENLGLPVRTEIVSFVDGKPGGAKSVVELREIKTEVDAETFRIPKDFRKISLKEMREIIKPK